MNQALEKLLPNILKIAIERAKAADESELVDFLETEGQNMLDHLLVSMGDQRIQNDKEDRAHFVAHLAATLAEGRAVTLAGVPELVRIANAVAAEALLQCGAESAPTTEPAASEPELELDLDGGPTEMATLPSLIPVAPSRVKPYRGYPKP